jgi:hypothetical protein
LRATSNFADQNASFGVGNGIAWVDQDVCSGDRIQEPDDISLKLIAIGDFRAIVSRLNTSRAFF